MNSIDFEIYKSIQQEKKLTEIYLGSVVVPWNYAIADYAADCTEAIPFTPFDKVICGLLNINDVMSFKEIASILGLNVIDNPGNNQYKDIAEYEILIEALTSLSDYGMIEKGDSFFSRCRLTEIGKEYAKQGKKFKTTENKEFQLYFDLITNNHDKTKEIFQDIKPDSTMPGIDVDYFSDENYLKTFAEKQIPEIYNPEYGNSFTNSSLRKISRYYVNLHAGILFDFQLNTYRIIIFRKQAKSEYFTENANATEELKTTIIQSFFSSLKPETMLKSELQQQFEEKTCEVQSETDFLLFQNKHQDAIIKINQYHKETDLIETSQFWHNIDIYIDNSVSEIFLNIPKLNEIHDNVIRKLSKARTDLRIFLNFQDVENDTDKFVENIYCNENTPYQKFSCFCNDWLISDFSYLITFETKTYLIDVLTKREIDNNAKVKEWKKTFAKKYIPLLLSELENFLQPDFEISLQNIEAIQSADKKVLYFENWFSDFGFDTRYNILKQKQDELLKRLKQQHKHLLLEKIDSLQADTDIESIEKLEQLNEIKGKFITIENDCISEYTEVLEKIENFKLKLAEKELYIKDQLLAKHYIIDTNVFVDYPEILSKIDIKHNVVLSASVIDKLDNLKRKLKGDEKANAEKALKLINQKLGKKKGNVKTARADLRLLPVDFNDKSPDNLILCVALMYKDKNPFLLTSNNDLQVKAKICEIPTISFGKFFYAKVKLPINIQTGKMIDVQILIDAYNSAIKKKSNVTFSEFNSALNNCLKGFSHKQYGFSKFKDFCNSLSEIFEIKLNEKEVECLILKTTI